MPSYKDATWRTGIKDDRVYVELWVANDTDRVMDFDLVPEAARNLAAGILKAADYISQRILEEQTI